MMIIITNDQHSHVHVTLMLQVNHNEAPNYSAKSSFNASTKIMLFFVGFTFIVQGAKLWERECDNAINGSLTKTKNMFLQYKYSRWQFCNSHACYLPFLSLHEQTLVGEQMFSQLSRNYCAVIDGNFPISV